MSIVVHTPHVIEEGQNAQPSAEKPFVVVTKASQPVKLLAYQPWAGAPPPPGVRTAAVIIVSEKKIDVDALREKARSALDEAPDAEGVVLVGSEGEIRGVLSTADVLSGLEGLSRGLKTAGYEPLPGPDPDVQTSLVYTCPMAGCTSPEVTIYQKGQEVPPCPIHNIPRVPKQSQE